MKRLISFSICIVIILSLACPTMAVTHFTPENPDVLPAGLPIGISPLAIFPSDETDLPYSATIYDLDAERFTYTKYYFCPGDSDLRILGTMYAAQGNCNDENRVRISLYRQNSDEPVDVYYTDYFDRHGAAIVAHTFTGLDPNAYYFFSIANAARAGDAEDCTVEGSFLVD